MIFFAGVEFFLTALNVYYGLNGTGNTALNWAAAVFALDLDLFKSHFTL